ncbi:hypothetical protein AHMF7616_01267 [Adhaeribacter pallidiroseus]|uniref:eCIS core domain-containing protein n=1 Tax=Adhaeribacter pallidiroseus TaxID=2072847 RepID=A0A369QCP6_9BACT|nr:hypothetical protein AHMF7616_01267 [Adhaeribacter pallidiroseus]
MNAKAYAVDNHVVFNKNQYNPDSAAGKKLLAHELAHVVQNYKPELLKTQQQKASNHPPVSQPIVETGKATNSKNKKAFACEGVEVEAQTRANYSNSFTFSKSIQPAADCEACSGPDCISASGTIVSVFRARPTVSLPAVPEGLTACERRAVRTFINTTLRQHEQQHVAAFNTYNGTVRTPYSYTGCKEGLNAYVQSIHDNLNGQREAAANATSDALDPFNPPIPCDCETL